jgi:hypothetical protein
MVVVDETPFHHPKNLTMRIDGFWRRFCCLEREVGDA